MNASDVLDLAIILMLGAALLFERRPRLSRGLLDDLEARSVVIHTRDNKSLAGQLVGVRPDGFLIENADTLTPDGRISIGTVVVPRANVSFFQRLPADGAE